MNVSKIAAIASALIALSTAFAVILPELNKSIALGGADILERVLRHFVQPDLFATDLISLDGEWLYVARSYDEGVLEELYRPDAPVSGWGRVAVPFMGVATTSNSTIWLRRDFQLPEHLGSYRIRLVFLGAFYKAAVWLNGVYLGEHEGYFSPFYFDVGGILNFGGNNTLVVCLSSPIELDLDNKRNLAGVFSDWDQKPYPRWALGRLPAQYEWTVPIGLWRPVVLAVSGPVSVNAVLVDALPEGGSSRIKFYVSNVGEAAQYVLSYNVSPHNFEGRGISGSLSFEIGKGESRWIELSVEIPDAKLWWTWDQGYPHLYVVRYEICSPDGVPQGRGSTKFGIRSVRGSSIVRGRANFMLNGRRVFLRGFNYISDFLLNASQRLLERDVRMMIEANANFVRVHAHVEPTDFYSLADEFGLAVQADGPLIWAYASRLSPLEYASFLERARLQFAEMVLLLYNHPSVVIWAVHNEPPWASEWMGDLYGRGVNRDLDAALAALISSLDGHERPIITGSGYEDQHVYYGWFRGSWVDFLHDYSTFPTELGAQSLPSITSPFWSLVNVSKWPIEEGDPEYYELAYRGFHWASGYVRVPYGLPRDYPSLADYVNASQEYQANLLRTAIARYRTLKFNTTAGVAVFLFKDCHPSASFSVVDYFGVPKLAYHTVAKMFKPLKVIVLLGGGFEARGARIAYKANSTLRAEIWVVNDSANVTGSATLSWRLVDAASGRVIDGGASSVLIPAAQEPARLIRSLRIEAPASIEGPSTLRLEVALSRDDQVVDEDSLSFVVDPLSRVVIKLEGAERPLNFYVLSDGYGFYLQDRGGNLSFALPAGSRAAVVGPVHDGWPLYAPVRLDLGPLKPGTTNVTLKLTRGALYTVRLPTLDSRVARSSVVQLHVEPEGQLEGPLIRKYEAEDELKLALKLRGNEFIVPAGTPVTLSFKVDGAMEVRGPMVLTPDARLVEEELAKELARKALAQSERELRQVKSMLASLEKQGFYVGLSRHLLERAAAFIKEAAALINSHPEQAIALLMEASSLLRGITARAGELKSSAQLNLPLLLLVVILASLGVASLIVESESARPAVATTLLVGLGILAYLTYPGFSALSAMEIFISLYVGFFALVAFTLLPYLLEGLRSERGVPLFAAAASALSMATRNLRRRGLRTGLALLSIATFSLAVTNLSSVSYVVTSRELVTAARHPANASNILAVLSQGVLSLADALHLSSQPEVTLYGFKVESRARAEPYTIVAGQPVRGFLGFYGYVPLNLTDVARPSYAFKQLETHANVALVSSTLRMAGVEIGDAIRVGDTELRVVGFFDPRALGELRDVGGYDLLPRVVNPDGSVGVAHPDEIIIVPALTALKIGGLVSRLYAEAQTPESLKSLAWRLALRPDYVVVALPAGDYQRVYFTGPVVEYRGGEALLPVALVFINVASVVLASVYERRGEIVTMASVGMNPTHIVLVFLSEALLLGFVGGSVGYVAGISAFRVVQWAGAPLPVDVKTSIWDLLSVISLSTVSSIVAALLPALKASQYATPSLRRRWKLEAQVIGEEWHVEVPVRVLAERVEQFVDYIVERLREEERGIERAVAGISVGKPPIQQRAIYSVSFTYSRGGGRPFNARVHMIVKPLDPEFYGVALTIRPESPYARFHRSYVQEVVTFVRTVALEWASLKVRLLVPVGTDVSRVVELVRNYHPQLVLLVSRRGDGRIVRELRGRLRAAGLRPPAAEVVQVKSGSLDELVIAVRDLIPKADVVALDSDDGLLSAAFALAAAIENRRVAVVREGRVEEVNVDKLLKLQ